MLTQIIVALIGAVGSIVTASVRARVEARPGNEGVITHSTRPMLVFVSTLAAGLAVTALVIAVVWARTPGPTGPQGPPVKLQFKPPVQIKNLKAAPPDNNAVPLGVGQNEGFCYISSICGEFHGCPESVSVFVSDKEPYKGMWMLQVKRGNSSAEVTATAQCVVYSGN